MSTKQETMTSFDSKKPFYPLNEVKVKIRKNEYRITLQALNDADTFFKWGQKDILECLLKLNDKLYSDDPKNNHFYKSEANRTDPPHMMDVYRAKKLKEENDVYTHLYIRNNQFVIINSFKKLLGG